MNVIWNDYLSKKRYAWRSFEDLYRHVATSSSETDCSAYIRQFHIYWGFERPRSDGQADPEYQSRDHSDWTFVFNGRNDLAYSVVELLIDQLRAGVDVRYHPSTREGVIRFCDYVVRFSGELTFEVGFLFDTNLIFPNNEIVTIRNDSFCLINLDTDVINRLNKQQSVLILDLSSSYKEPIATALPTGTVIPEELLWGYFP